MWRGPVTSACSSSAAKAVSRRVCVAKLVAQQRDLEKHLKQLQGKLAGSQSEDLMSKARQVDGITVLVAQVDGLDDAALRDLADRLREQIRSGLVVLGTARDDRAVLLAAVTKDLTKAVDDELTQRTVFEETKLWR